MRPLNDAAKKEVAALDEKGLLVKHKFPLSWTWEHFKYDESEYACWAKSLFGGDSRTLRVLLKWVDKFATRVRKID